jgi:hypothetical protein
MCCRFCPSRSQADHFKIDNLRQRLDVLKADPWAEMLKLRQRLPL